jgi:DNA mismatch repair protein MutH
VPTLEYDPSDKQSILAYAEKLVGRTLREAIDGDATAAKGKGRFGAVLEEYYFGYKPNSRPEPDFAKAGLELKSTPSRQKGRKLRAKERLSLGMIDYMAIETETWEDSSLRKKNQYLLLVVYLYEPDKSFLDYTIKHVRLWEFPAEDLEIIRDDWERIIDKVRQGLAHEISCGDTLYLEAAPKGANSQDLTGQPHSPIKAMRRAFALKQSYMDAVIGGLENTQAIPSTLEGLRAGRSFEDLVCERFALYVGKSADAIADELGLSVKRGAKNFYAVLTKRILGVADEKSIQEFEKADLVVRTVRLKPNGVPKEDISFPAFDYRELVDQQWDESDLHACLSKRFFFVLYQLDKAGTPVLVGTRFWTMPVADIDGPARRCFDKTVGLIREDRAEYLPKKSDNPVCHVRPHGRDSRDLVPTPSGRLVCRKSFWLNGSYVAGQLKGM